MTCARVACHLLGLGLRCGWVAPQLISELPYGRLSQGCGAAAVGVLECSISRAAVAPAVHVRVWSVRLLLLAFVFRSRSFASARFVSSPVTSRVKLLTTLATWRRWTNWNGHTAGRSHSPRPNKFGSGREREQIDAAAVHVSSRGRQQLPAPSQCDGAAHEREARTNLGVYPSARDAPAKAAPNGSPVGGKRCWTR